LLKRQDGRGVLILKQEIICNEIEKEVGSSGPSRIGETMKEVRVKFSHTAYVRRWVTLVRFIFEFHLVFM